MSKRNTAREGELIDQKFAQIYKPIEALLDVCVFDIPTGKLKIPGYLDDSIRDATNRWNYQATLFNRKLTGAKANFGAIKVKWDKDCKIREVRMFLGAVSQIIKNKYGLSEKDIDVEFIYKLKEEGKTPAQVVDFRIMELAETITPYSRFDYKHKHEWEIIQDRFTNWHIVCLTCLKLYDRTFKSKEEATEAAPKLPKTNLGLLLTHFKRY